MGLELIVEKYKNDLPGFKLCGYREVGFPQYKSRVLSLMLKDKRLPVIDEYVLRLYKENISIDDMWLLLGIEKELVKSSWYNLIHLGLIHAETKWITERGYSYLREHSIKSNEKIYIDISIDGLSGEIKRNRTYVNRKTARETNLTVLNALEPQPSEYNIDIHKLKKVLSEYQSIDPETYNGSLLDIIQVENNHTQYKRLNILIFVNDNGEFRFMVCDDAQRYEEYEVPLNRLEDSGVKILNYKFGNYFENNDLQYKSKFKKEYKDYLSLLEIRNNIQDILRTSKKSLYIALPLVDIETPDHLFIDSIIKKVKEKVSVYILVSGREFIDSYQKDQYEKLINISRKYNNLKIINIPVFQCNCVVSESSGVLSWLEKHILNTPTSEYGVTKTGFLLNGKESIDVAENIFLPQISCNGQKIHLLTRTELQEKLKRIIKLVIDFDEYLLNKNNIGWIGGTMIPHTQRLLEAPIATTENDFKVFISSIHTSLGESLEKNGKSHGNNKYFWTDFKSEFPDLQKVLHKIRIYRHSTEHISLEDQPKETYFKFLEEDLDGVMPIFKENGYEVLQTTIINDLEKILEELLIKQ